MSQNIISAILASVTVSEQATETPTVDILTKINQSINLIKKLNDMPAAHNFISNFYIEDVTRLETAISVFSKVGLSDDQLKSVDETIDFIINKMEADVKSKLTGILHDLNFDALAQLSGLTNLLK